jgi:hypothetical protein
VACPLLNETQQSGSVKGNIVNELSNINKPPFTFVRTAHKTKGKSSYEYYNDPPVRLYAGGNHDRRCHHWFVGGFLTS